MSDAQIFLQTQTPIELFSTWFAEAKNTSLKYPDAFTLSTVADDGTPSSRIVLLKEIQPTGLAFYSNYGSKKGKDIDKNPNVALNFYWDPLFKQVKWKGTVSKLSRDESEKYWASRPRASQLAQWVSRQSSPVLNRKQMEQELNEAEQKFLNKTVPLPANWGGYLFTPTYVEFWVGQEGRFHDRYAYHKVENKWTGQRLYP